MEIKDNTVVLTDDEVKELVMDSIDEEVTGSGRWDEYVDSIVSLDTEGVAKFARISWSRGLTEMQENEYFGGEFPLVEEIPSITIEKSYKWVNKKDLSSERDSIDENIESLRAIADDKAISEEVKALENVDLHSLLEQLDKVDLLALTSVMADMKDIVNEYERQRTLILKELKK